MKKNIFCPSIIIILLLLNIAIIVLNNRITKLFNTKLMAKESTLNEKEIEAKELKEQYLVSTVSSNQSILKDLKIINNQLDTISLENVIENGSTYLVFRFTYSNCRDCINKVIKTLIENKEKFINTKVLVISYFTKLDEMQYFSNSILKNEFPIYTTLDKSFGIPADTLKLPYVCMVDEKGKSQNLFFVQNITNLTFRKYLASVIQNINSSN